MNKMQTIARITLAAIALYMILEFAKSTFTNLYFLGHGSELPFISLFMMFLAIVLMIILIVIIGRELIGHGDKWACRIVAHAQEYEAEEKTNWLPTAYHIIAISLGILFIWWTIPYIVQSAAFFLLSLKPGYEQLYTTSRAISTLITVIVQLIISVYLLCGAPHFVRWQVKKTLELCEEFGGSEGSQESKQN